MERLAKIIRDVLLQQFPDAGIDRVLVASGVDEDGDKILRVTVGVQAKNTRATAGLVGATRAVMTKLAQEGQDDFPVLSFVSKREMSRTRRAAA